MIVCLAEGFRPFLKNNFSVIFIRLNHRCRATNAEVMAINQ